MINNKKLGLTEELKEISVLNENNKTFFSCKIYENTGKAILVSILDVFNKNPYSRIPNSTF